MPVEFFALANPPTHVFFLWLTWPGSGVDATALVRATPTRDALAAELDKLLDQHVPDRGGGLFTPGPAALPLALMSVGRAAIDTLSAADALLRLCWTPESN